jgi:SUN domain-containing protein 1/2
MLGTVVNFVARLFLFCVMFAGRVFGLIYDLLLNRPGRFTRRHSNRLLMAATWVTALAVAYLAYTLSQRPLSQLFSPSPSPIFVAPDTPAANIDELNTRLRQIEAVVSSLSKSLDSSRAQLDAESRNQAAMGGRISALETYRSSADQGIHAIRHQIDSFHTQLDAVAKLAQERSPGTISNPSEIVVSDEEARTLLRRLEERVAGMEDNVQEALELGKNAVNVDPSFSNEKGAAWWNKLASGVNSGLTIKTIDGQDITNLIRHLVDGAVSMYGKDVIARQDFALASAGAQVIPSLTSLTLTVQPPTVRRKIMGWISGTGYLEGRPPVTALHHDIHEGHCWPFEGSQGHLGVALKAPVFISDVTIDHVAKEVASDIRGAPKDMELWGMVEGKNNQEKVLRWREEQALQKAARKAEAEARGEEWTEELEEYPKMLSTNPPYIRIAKFTYDIDGPNNIQTFPALPEIQELGIDFGIVTLLIQSNWGRPESTCLYRLRVHGEQYVQDTPQESTA